MAGLSSEAAYGIWKTKLFRFPEAAVQALKNPLPGGSGLREATDSPRRQVIPLPLRFVCSG